jgi:uncharacterized linocin/CFP29 family protein
MTWRDRESAPFTQETWDAIDGVVQAAAEEVRAARRVMEVLGPLGFEARAGVAEDQPATPTDESGVPHVHAPTLQPMPVLHRSFALGARSVEAFISRGEPLALTEAADAARQLARLEDRLLVEGNSAAGVRGLLEQQGAIELPAADWSDPLRAGDDLLGALARLDEAGRHGPYAAAVSPSRYYQLLRPHPDNGVTPLEQLAPAFAGGIFKAPTLRNMAIVVMRSASGPRAVLGEELTAAYDRREGIFHRLSLIESITLLPGVAGSVAVLRG